MRRVAFVAVVVAVVLGACGSPADIGGETVPPTTAAPAPTAGPTVTLPVEPPSTVSEPQGPEPAGAPPWDRPPLAQEAVSEVLVAEWNDAVSACSALFPSDPAVIPWDASIRSADFGGDSWAVAWDMPDGPGREPTGAYCANCGRGAFGVAGVGGIEVEGDEHLIWPDQLSWDDGSKAGYGFEGLAEPGSGAPLLMYLLVKDEACLYDVWSFLGEEHLLALTSSLRRVEGLAGPTTPWRIDLPPPEVRELGEPAWGVEEPLAQEEIASLYLDEWMGEAGAPASCPLLVFSDLGQEAADAIPRRAANEGEMLVAWDRPSGPGHTGDSEPCADCGRGVVGLGTFQSFVPAEARVTHRWEDGSVGDMYEGFYGTEMHLRPAGFDCTYWLWSHLGPDHLEYLLTRLRRAEGLP
jgi:hypothetical protein